MLTLKPVISIVLDTRRANKENLYPVKLRATFKVGKKKWLQKYYSLDIALSKEDFQTATKGNPRSTALKEAAKKISSAKQQADKILEDHTFVTLEMFSRLFASKGDVTTVGSVFNLIMAEMLKAGRIGNYNMYKTARNSVARFVDPELKKMKTRKKEDDIQLNMAFFQINKDWLAAYIDWLRGEAVSPTTMAMYLRHLRAVFNRAIALQIIKPDLYPFGRNGYRIKKTWSRKIALSEADKNRLLAIEDPETQEAIDFWAFSFFNFGINMLDMALLKLKDLKHDVIMVDRQKTKETDFEAKPLKIPLREESKKIIQRWGNKTLNPNEYVFPILKAGLSPTQIKNRVNDFTGKINAGLRKVQLKLGLEVELTTYTARHTFASIALEKGASLEFIQEALGHASMETTMVYTSGLGIKTIRAVGARIYD
jgi:integrase/recombinase XerD